MASHDSLLIRHALAVLREFAEPRSTGAPGPAVKLALRTLLPHVSDRNYIDVFWQVANVEPGLGKRGNLLAVLEVIERRLPPQIVEVASAGDDRLRSPT